MPFLDLPQIILEEIIGLAIESPYSDAPRNNITVFLDSPALRGHHRLHSRRFGGRNTILSLLLFSQTISALTRQLLYHRAVFHALRDVSMEGFMDLIGEDNSQLLSNVDLTFRFDQYFVGMKPVDPMILYGTQQAFSETMLERSIALMERLSSDLYSFRLQSPSFTPPTITPFPSKLVEAFQRFSNLRELELVFFENRLFLDIFWTTPSPPSDNLGPRPIFPFLRRLHLRGRLGLFVSEAHLTRALSEEQLPSLQILQIRDLTSEVTDLVDKPRFTPEVLLAIRPLSEFEWTSRDNDTDFCGKSDFLHEPPSEFHLDALESRHGKTLRILTIHYKNCCSCTYSWRTPLRYTQAEWRQLVGRMPNLKEWSVYVHPYYPTDSD